MTAPGRKTSYRRIAMLALLGALGPTSAAMAAVGADRNHDGMTDAWQHRYAVKAGVASAYRDLDRDGLTNRRESHFRTNPRKKDTDGDRVADGVEVRARSNPRDKRSTPTSVTAAFNDVSTSLNNISSDEKARPKKPTAAPVASFTLRPVSATTGQVVTFDGRGSTCASTPCTYTWRDVGADGTQSWPLGSGATASYTFQNAGDKYVQLVVQDSLGRSSAASQKLTVSAPVTTTPPPPTTTAPPTTTTTTPPPPTTTTTPTGGTDVPTTTTCSRSATTATFASELSAATAGQVICLASGNYGTFAGTSKAVTIQPQSGATVTMGLNFTTGDSGFTLNGLTIPGGRITFGAKDITIRRSSFTDHLFMDGLANSNIVLDGNRHVGITTCATCDPAMIHLAWSSATHSGVTIKNSYFADGNSDGIQTGVGVNIINNEFYNLHEVDQNDPAHTDPIQLLYAKGAVVRGNYIHRTADGIVAYDGVDSALIEDNVIDLIDGPSPIPFGNGARWGIELYSDRNSIVRHNTLVYDTRCSYAPCGHIMIDHKSTDPAGTGTQVYDNLATVVEANNGSSYARRDHNMVRTSAGSGDFLGTPVFAGGSAPTTWAGYRLAPGSPGKGAASDGTDVGIR